jgi:galactose mutarotase-like enzyme
MNCEIKPFSLPGNPEARLVRLTDERRGVRISVLPAAGGEITSFQIRIGGKWTEILSRAGDYHSAPPDGWDGRAPLLWPAVGRSFTADQVARWTETGRKPRACRYQLDGKTYAIANHGFARAAPWTLEDYGCGKNSAWARCSLRSSPATKKLYPFDFDLAVTYTLAAGSVRLRYEVTAGENRRPMPFAIGNHISFRMPFTGQGRFEDCAIRTSANRRLGLDGLALLSGRSEPVNLRRPMPLAHAEFLDAVLGGCRRRRAWFELMDPASLTLRVSHAEESRTGHYRAAERDIFFVLWGTAEHRYFCPEPWIGRPNALNTRRGGIRLPPGERFVWNVRFTPTIRPRTRHGY